MSEAATLKQACERTLAYYNSLTHRERGELCSIFAFAFAVPASQVRKLYKEMSE